MRYDEYFSERDKELIDAFFCRCGKEFQRRQKCDNMPAVLAEI